MRTCGLQAFTARTLMKHAEKIFYAIDATLGAVVAVLSIFIKVWLLFDPACRSESWPWVERSRGFQGTSASSWRFEANGPFQYNIHICRGVFFSWI